MHRGRAPTGKYMTPKIMFIHKKIMFIQINLGWSKTTHNLAYITAKVRDVNLIITSAPN